MLLIGSSVLYSTNSTGSKSEFNFPVLNPHSPITLFVPLYLSVLDLIAELLTPLGSSRLKAFALLSDPVNLVETGILIVADFVSGNETTETIANIQGFDTDFGIPVGTTPGNSIWRYSDGRPAVISSETGWKTKKSN